MCNNNLALIEALVTYPNMPKILKGTFLEWLKPFVQPRKFQSNFPEKIDDLETKGRESDENGSNSDFGDDQDGEGEFSISDMDDNQKNFPKLKLKPVSNEGKRKPLLLKGSQQQSGRDDKHV